MTQCMCHTWFGLNMGGLFSPVGVFVRKLKCPTQPTVLLFFTKIVLNKTKKYFNFIKNIRNPWRPRANLKVEHFRMFWIFLTSKGRNFELDDLKCKNVNYIIHCTFKVSLQMTAHCFNLWCHCSQVHYSTLVKLTEVKLKGFTCFFKNYCSDYL